MAIVRKYQASTTPVANTISKKERQEWGRKLNSFNTGTREGEHLVTPRGIELTGGKYYEKLELVAETETAQGKVFAFWTARSIKNKKKYAGFIRRFYKRANSPGWNPDLHQGISIPLDDLDFLKATLRLLNPEWTELRPIIEDIYGDVD